MNLKEARLLFQAGALSEPVIRKAEGGWSVLLEGKHPLNPALETARGQVRVFKTLDAAAETVFEIGFAKATIMDRL
ncbi:hypothetical protein ACW73L_19680 [Methylolobus aquaticus]